MDWRKKSMNPLEDSQEILERRICGSSGCRKSARFRLFSVPSWETKVRRFLKLLTHSSDSEAEIM